MSDVFDDYEVSSFLVKTRSYSAILAMCIQNHGNLYCILWGPEGYTMQTSLPFALAIMTL